MISKINSAFQVANFFLKKGQEEGVEITPMKLIKLTYIAHGWNLGFNSEPLLDEQIYAWKYGPVIHSLYERFKTCGSRPITELHSEPHRDGAIEYPMPTADTEPLLGVVWKAYSKYDGIQLSAMTHQKGTPWYRIWNEEGGKDGRDVPIPNNYIEEHYKQKIKELKEGTAVA